LEKELHKKVIESLNDIEGKVARQKALQFIRDKQEVLKDNSDLMHLKFTLKSLEKKNLFNWKKLIASSVNNLKANGCYVYFAQDGKKAFNYLKKIIPGNLVVKSKTNTGKEINLVKNLERMGFEVIETDLGDRIVQLDGSEPSHPLVPALHIPRSRIITLFDTEGKSSEDLTAREIVDLAREQIRSKILESEVGITGANALTADEGLICLIENEGNQRLITSLPKKHVVITGIDKIVENISEATLIAKVAALFGLGEKTAGYISFLKGPSRTGDLGFEIIEGMHGPEEVHVIILDNKRSDILESSYSEILFCISCGGCVNYCPVYEQVGGIFGSGGGGRGAVFIGLTRGLRDGYLAGLDLCTECGECVQSCPTSIDVPNLIIKMRKEAREKKLTIKHHDDIRNQIINEGNPFDKKDLRSQWFKKQKIHVDQDAKRLFYVGCMASYKIPDQAIHAMKLMNKLNISFNYLFNEEPCCGGILKRTGYVPEFENQKAKVRDILKQYSEIIVICPGCYSTFHSFYNDFFEIKGIRVKHLTEILPQYIQHFEHGKETLTYHDPCHLGRHGRVYDSPRQVLNKVGNLVEMRFNKERSYCCGAGGGCMSAFPEVTKQICKTRLSQAHETNANYLINTCPFCEYNFKETNSSRIKITSLQKYLSTKCLK